MRGFGKVKSGKQRRAGFGLERLGLNLFLVGALLIGGVAWYFHDAAARQAAESRHHETALTAENLAERVAALMRQHGETMELVAKDPDLKNLILAGKADALREREAELGFLFPTSIAVRILPPGLDQVDMDASPPISYAVLDMLRQAETRETPPPAEVHLYGTPQQHINMVRPIHSPSGRRIIGSIMVSFSTPILQQALSAPRNARGYGEIQQVAGNGEIVALATRGDAALRQGRPDVTVPVEGTRWQVAYWAEAPGLVNSIERLAAVAGGGIALYGVLVLLLMRWFGGLWRQDQNTILGAIRDAAGGGLAPDYQVRLSPNVWMLDGLRKLYAAGQVGRVGAARAPADRREPAMAPEAATEPDAPLPLIDDEPEFADASLLAGQIDVSEVSIDPSIFRAYDIRGVVETNLTPEVVYQIGRAIGSEAQARGEKTVVVGRDGRLSGQTLMESLIRGLLDSGCDVKDIGEVPTPVLYFAAQYLDSRSGVMLTGSHNPPEYNGLKIVLAGETLSGDDIQRLRTRIETGELERGAGQLERVPVVGDYIEQIRGDVLVPRPLKVVIDCGNGVAGAVAPQLIETLGCEVIPLFCDVDGAFPNHHPDPSKPENLTVLIDAVLENGADIGIAFDGDGDRLGVVASSGEIIWPDRLMMLFSMDVLSRNPGAEIIYDVKCSRHLPRIIRDFGGAPEMWKTGHSLIKARMKETGALLAGEMSGHIFFKERWFGFDDALYAAARLLEILSNDHRSSSEIFAALPDSVNTPELNVAMQEGQPHEFMQRLLEMANFEGAEISTIDGLRADFSDGWGLVRASNTTPVLVLRFEADDEVALRRIQDNFKHVMEAVEPKLALPF